MKKTEDLIGKIKKERNKVASEETKIEDLVYHMEHELKEIYAYIRNLLTYYGKNVLRNNMSTALKDMKNLQTELMKIKESGILRSTISAARLDELTKEVNKFITAVESGKLTFSDVKKRKKEFCDWILQRFGSLVREEVLADEAILKKMHEDLNSI